MVQPVRKDRVAWSDETRNRRDIRKVTARESRRRLGLFECGEARFQTFVNIQCSGQQTHPAGSGSVSGYRGLRGLVDFRMAVEIQIGISPEHDHLAAATDV